MENQNNDATLLREALRTPKEKRDWRIFQRFLKTQTDHASHGHIETKTAGS